MLPPGRAGVRQPRAARQARGLPPHRL